MSDLLKINVNAHTEKKNGLTYLSWAWAWAEVLKIDPQATWEAHEYNGMPCIVMPDSSCMVKVSVTIKSHTKSCLLPVMNHRNQAIKGPDAFAINTAIVRCLTKAISMHGLGLYIYAGEDLPEEDEQEQKKPEPKKTVIKATDGAEDAVSDERRAELEEMVMDWLEAYKEGQELPAINGFYGLTDNDDKVYAWKLLGAESKLRATIKKNNPRELAA